MEEIDSIPDETAGKGDPAVNVAETTNVAETEESPPNPKNLIAEGESMFEAFKNGDRFKFLSAKLKEKHELDLLEEISK